MALYARRPSLKERDTTTLSGFSSGRRGLNPQLRVAPVSVRAVRVTLVGVAGRTAGEGGGAQKITGGKVGGA